MSTAGPAATGSTGAARSASAAHIIRAAQERRRLLFTIFVLFIPVILCTPKSVE